MANSHVQVLIVGAGPTGLALANLLASHNIAFRILDKNSHASDKSKALGVQAGTLEVINFHLGQELSEQMVKAGNPIREACFNFYNKVVVTSDLSLIPSIYNFILILPQSETERIFEQRLKQLNLEIERESELLSLTQNADQVQARIKTQQGEENITADFVIGCDGAHSLVRHQLNLDFAGGEYVGNFILGDVKAEAFNKKNALQLFLSSKGALAYFPIQANGLGRLILIPKDLKHSDTPDISLNEFNKIVEELTSQSVHVTEAPWLSRFTIHHRMANHFRQGRIFLAGDSAHIHSPAGGQGMNTGIQDAFNLGFKLIKVLSDRADFNLLNLYEKQRYPIAKQILRNTDLASRYVIFNNHFLAGCFKKHILARIVSLKWVQKKLVSAISEVSVARKEIQLCK